jgi:hypothetical protein
MTLIHSLQTITTAGTKNLPFVPISIFTLKTFICPKRVTVRLRMYTAVYTESKYGYFG